MEPTGQQLATATDRDVAVLRELKANLLKEVEKAEHERGRYHDYQMEAATRASDLRNQLISIDAAIATCELVGRIKGG